MHSTRIKKIRTTCLLGLGFLALGSLTSKANDLERGLLAYLPLRVDLDDHSPAKMPVKASGGVELRDGGAYFKGQSNWLTLPHIDFDHRPFSVSMWVNTTGRNPMYGLIEQRADNVPNHWLHIMLRGGRQPYLGFYVNDAISPQDIPLHRWTHLVFQYNGKQQELWIDGQLMCARTTGAYGGDSGDTVIGKSPEWNNVPSKDFEGYMREIRIYGRALSADEVAALYTFGNDSQPGLRPVASQSPAGAANPNALAAEVGIPFLAINGRKLVITGESKQIYDVLATSDLSREWQPLVTLTNESGVLEYTDPESSNVPQRFYRIKVRQQ